MNRAGGLYGCTSLTSMLNGWCRIPAQLSVQVYSVISGKHIGQKCQSSLKERNFSSWTWWAHSKSSTPSCQIPKGNQICGNTSIYISERQMAELMVMLLSVNSAIPLSDLWEETSSRLKHMKHHHPLSLFLWSSSSFWNWTYSTFGSRIYRHFLLGICPHQSAVWT